MTSTTDTFLDLIFDKEAMLGYMGSMCRTSDVYDNFYLNQYIKLDTFYDNESLSYIKIEPLPGTNLQLDKEYFTTNKFKLVKCEYDNENRVDKRIFKNDNIEFYILYNFGSSGDFSCCASIILRYTDCFNTCELNYDPIQYQQTLNNYYNFINNKKFLFIKKSKYKFDFLSITNRDTLISNNVIFNRIALNDHHNIIFSSVENNYIRIFPVYDENHSSLYFLGEISNTPFIVLI